MGCTSVAEVLAAKAVETFKDKSLQLQKVVAEVLAAKAVETSFQVLIDQSLSGRRGISR